MKRLICWTGLTALLLAAPGGAAPEAAITWNGKRCITLRAAAHGQSPEERADWAMGLLRKHAGREKVRFATFRRGREMQILLNGEVLLAVTRADARADDAPSIPALAGRWRGALAKALAGAPAVPAEGEAKPSDSGPRN